jgi:hypothetical protein
MAEERRRGMAILQTHQLRPSCLKHLLLFSVDKIERDLCVLQKDENHDPANVTQPYILSIEEI